MNNNICIDNRRIGVDQPPYIIAEISANHNGNINNALALIKAAKQAGADAVKIQTYRADTITLKSDKPEFKISGGLWDGNTLYQLYESAYTPWEWHKELFDYARKQGITLFSSPFDNSAVDLLEELNAPAYKIASFEAIDLPLIKYVASTGKPMIISTGMANEQEISEAIEAAKSAGCKQLAILHCVSGYPAPASDYNLHTLTDMQSRFGLVTGLSDHTIDNTTAITAVALGAAIVEKHVTLDRLGGGPDDSFSIEPKELSQLCQSAGTAWSAMGLVSYSQASSEQQNIQFRRSLYTTKSIKKGDVLSTNNIGSVRPGYGLAPKWLDEVLGSKAKIDIDFATPLSWELISKTST
ncbi:MULTISPECIES: pseudaminic acid synthase [unclassified Agarivorans]|uniref:pseudaminic acid synthase n=1 Tax=unclassified Agarivorans TaxID=2636026 RepID=UPI0026E3C24E|nr:MULTISPECIES: pseudaminic acid synthase [unclassified Agarivorans]MDO6684706.1 pseudaminic acid synthase [Agarivorans sp. 3_MG-2023]MDO6715133.1 pseudaminic acid synthase [Agarivorans sp. 2_MG-2023]